MQYVCISWHFLSKYTAHGLMFTITLYALLLFCENQNLFVLLWLVPIEFVIPSKWPLSIFCWSPSNTHTHQRVLRLLEKAETQQWVSHRGLNAYLTALPMKSGYILATTVLHINGCDMMGLVYSAWMVEREDLALFSFFLLCHIPTAVFNTMHKETTGKLPMICLAWNGGHLVYCKE